MKTTIDIPEELASLLGTFDQFMDRKDRDDGDDRFSRPGFTQPCDTTVGKQKRRYHNIGIEYGAQRIIHPHRNEPSRP